MIPSSDLRKLNTDSPIIELYTVQFRNNPIVRFANLSNAGGAVVYGGNTYTCHPIYVSGIQATGDGTLPRPSISVGNTANTVINTFGTFDLVGAKVSRILTLQKYLDGQPSANSGNYSIDVYYVEQITSANQELIQYSLSTPLEVLSRKLPKQQITTDKYPGVGRAVGY